ncbi:MAG: threonine aldolase [Myxococcales bacterium]|nr:threonine aldolase [Myxococcales bacterium]MCB9750541.1 threonine aldolase [Myxococcales bacterium]
MCPEALSALSACEGGYAIGYGDDDETARAVAAFRALFGADTGVFFVATGTAANTLAVAAMTEPWQRVVCHQYSHWADDESTAPERVTLCRTTALASRADPTKLAPEDLKDIFTAGRRDVHSPAPGVLTLTNPTELGTVYTPAETRALCELAHAHGYRVHVDGARFANAVATVSARAGLDPGATCRALTVDAGVDALSFGGTKNGLAFGEAVLFFPQVKTPDVARAITRFPYLRKSTGHLLSKHRFVSAPFARVLDGARAPWLAHASRANAMARRLVRGLERQGLEPQFVCEANGVFIRFAPALDQALRAQGYAYYPFESPRGPVARLMCSFNTPESAVDGLLVAIERASA